MAVSNSTAAERATEAGMSFQAMVGTWLPTQPLKPAASAAIAATVGSRRLTVPRIVIQHDALDGVLQSGVLVPTGDLVSSTEISIVSPSLHHSPR